MKLIDTRYCFVNVADTEYRNYGNFKIPLPDFQTGAGLTNRIYIKKVILPFDWKAFTSANNTISITVDNAPQIFTLTEGSPNIYDLIQEINSIQSYVTASFNRTASKIYWKNKAQSAVTISSTGYAKLGLNSGNSSSIAIGATYISPNIVDIAPTRIVIIKNELRTSGEEVHEGETRDTGILSAIYVDVPMYSHKIWRDLGGFYYSYIDRNLNSVRFWLEDVNGNPIIPQTSPFMVIAIETYEDDSGELLRTQQKSLELQKYSLLLKGNRISNKILTKGR